MKLPRKNSREIPGTVQVEVLNSTHFRRRIPVNVFDFKQSLGGMEIYFGYWTGRVLPENHVYVFELAAEGVVRANESMTESFCSAAAKYLVGTEPPRVLSILDNELEGARVTLEVHQVNFLGLSVSISGGAVTGSWLAPDVLQAGHRRASAEPTLLANMTPVTFSHFVAGFRQAAGEFLGTVADSHPYLATR